jgi:nitroreductase
VIVKKPDTKEVLAVAASNQKSIAKAAMVVVILSNSSAYPKPSAAPGRIGYKQNPMIAIEHMILAATALGYGTCWIGAFEESEVKRIVNARENLTVIALLPIGVPDEEPPARPRKQLAEIAYSEKYGTKLDL